MMTHFKSLNKKIKMVQTRMVCLFQLGSKWWPVKVNQLSYFDRLHIE